MTFADIVKEYDQQREFEHQIMVILDNNNELFDYWDNLRGDEG